MARGSPGVSAVRVWCQACACFVCSVIGHIMGAAVMERIEAEGAFVLMAGCSGSMPVFS